MTNEEPVSSEDIDFEAVAVALNVPRETLPDRFSRMPKQKTGVPFVPLSDEEWKAVAAVMPKLPVPKPNADYNDRIFLDAVLWWIEAKARGYSWHRLPTNLGPQSSREHRARRWVLLNYWQEIAEKLSNEPRISPDRLRAFQRIAEDATVRKSRLLKQRARLTDVVSAAACPLY